MQSALISSKIPSSLLMDTKFANMKLEHQELRTLLKVLKDGRFSERKWEYKNLRQWNVGGE